MADSGPTASIIFFVVIILIDVFFYGFGEALSSLNEKEVERRAEEKDKRAVRLKKIIDNPREYTNTMQLITTLNHMLMGVVLPSVLLHGSAVLSTILVLYITLTLGILLPQRLALRIPESWAYFCINPVSFFNKLFLPITGLVSLTVRGILRLLGMNGRQDEADVTEEEIISMVNEGHEQGVIQASEAEMISNIFEFCDKEAQEIMTHRKNMVAINADTSLKDAIAFMLEGKYSRYPVYEKSIDRIVGILHLKDAMRFRGMLEQGDIPLRELEDLLRTPSYVPRTKNIDELFREMQADKQQMVIVVDEYGQTDGLIAMEDMLEEIVGNIMDEYDVESRHIEEKGKDEYIIEGMTPLEELEECIGVSFEDEESETLNGFLISRLGKIPEPDEQFDVDYKGYHFKILSVENKMIQKVLVTRLPEEATEQE